MYTIDQELAEHCCTKTHVNRHLCLLAKRRHFSAWNDVMATIMKLWRQIINPTPSIDAYIYIYIKTIAVKISSSSDLKWQSLTLF